MSFLFVSKRLPSFPRRAEWEGGREGEGGRKREGGRRQEVVLHFLHHTHVQSFSSHPPFQLNTKWIGWFYDKNIRRAGRLKPKGEVHCSLPPSAGASVGRQSPLIKTRSVVCRDCKSFGSLIVIILKIVVDANDHIVNDDEADDVIGKK